MFNVILLTSALYVFSSLQNRTSSHVWVAEREVPVGPNRSLFPGPFVIPLPLAPLAAPFPRRFASASACVVCFGARCFDQQCVPHRRGQLSRPLVHFEDCIAAVDPRVSPSRLVLLAVRRSCLRCSSPPLLPSLLTAPGLALLSIS